MSTFIKLLLDKTRFSLKKLSKINKQKINQYRQFSEIGSNFAKLGEIN